MADFKVVFVYRAPQGKGFTEVYYRTAADINAASVFDAAFINLATNLHNRATMLKKIRVNDVLQPRVGVIVPVNKAGTAPSQNNYPDVTQTAAICILSSSQFGSKRNLWLRGLNDDDVELVRDTGADNISTTLRQNIETWCRRLNANGFTIRSLTPVSQPGMQYININRLGGTAGGGTTTVFYSASIPVLPSSRVIISQMNSKLYPALNGHWSTSNAQPGQFDIKYNLPAAPPSAEKTGRWRVEAYRYGLIDPPPKSQFDHFGSRATGRGFTVGRGRRPAQHLRSL